MPTIVMDRVRVSLADQDIVERLACAAMRGYTGTMGYAPIQQPRNSRAFIPVCEAISAELAKIVEEAQMIDCPHCRGKGKIHADGD